MKPIIASLLVLLLASCRTTADYQTASYQNAIFAIAGVQGCSEANSGDAVEAQIGIVTCDDFSLSYDYGKYGFRGPQTLEESFEASFAAYHYTKFFELTHIDPKVQKLFIDSVELVNVYEASAVTDSTLFDCSTCNVVAELLFKQKTYLYPTTMNENLVQAAKKQPVQQYTSAGQQIKLYTDATDKQGAVIKPENYQRKDDYLSVTVLETTKKPSEVEKILRSIHLVDQ